MFGNPGSYANKKRKKPVLKQKKVSDANEIVKSNPSKRHRDRLNGELDWLTDLLPFSEEIRSRLDKLSVLRLSVGYLRVKSYFNVTSKNSNGSLTFPGLNGQNGNNMTPTGFSEGELLLQALNGFVIVVTSDGLVFYVSSTIKNYLGFHQSDLVHQSVFELIHTDDRAMFRQQLHFGLNPPTATSGDDLQSYNNAVMYSPEELPPENSSFLERSFVCRFRCLLDNSSGFVTLKIQGRLKYLHGQNGLRDSRTYNKPQLALFSIVMPVQPPPIVEIRAKMLLFQTKHKLDFTPMGIDSRGKVILGYSETELCMKGSGYQFIHAADMMYCADSHIHMIKTGETGLIVFRLLSKSGGWVWVKSNAKLIYKGGRPEFIIAYQRALVNAEGEEHWRQRRMQLPFSFTTGEGILYDTGPTVNISQFQFDKMFSSSDMHKHVTPGSLLDCFLKQGETAYTQTVDVPLPMDQVFMDSGALVSISSDTGQNSGTAATAGPPVVVKEETKQSVMSVIDNLEKMAHNGRLCSVLQNLDVPDTELMSLENALKRLSQDEDQQNNVSSELDSILTNDIFDYMDSVLFKEKGEHGHRGSAPSCPTPSNNHLQEPFVHAAQVSATGLCEPELFQTQNSGCMYSPMKSVYSQQQDTLDGAVNGQTESTQLFSSTQKLSHYTPQADANLPFLQLLQHQDFFSLSVDLPQPPVPDASPDNASAIFQSGSQTHMGCPLGISGQIQSNQLLLCPQNDLQASEMIANEQLLQSSVTQPNNVAARAMDILPPLISCNGFNSSGTANIPISFNTACLQRSPPLETHNQQFQQCLQSQQQKLPHAGIVQKGHELMPACHSQTPESQAFSNVGLWPRSVTGLNHAQQGVLACGQAATQSSCMFNPHFSSGPAGVDILTLSGSSDKTGADSSLDQSPPQGSCYFQWVHSEPVVGTSAINQENVNISPQSVPSSASSSEHMFNMQHYLDYHKQTSKHVPQPE